ncbi:MAG TPA: metallophosphoesterase [Verrucomicrobiota bacterium]|nr:metallophosphoesterase [Verrucomicrobiota bacterium]
MKWIGLIFNGLILFFFSYASHCEEIGLLSNLTRTVRIALVSDVHINHGTNRALYQSNYEKVIEQVNSAGVDFVVVAGDLTEDGTADEYADFKRLTKKFKSPVRALPGNHDIGNKVLGKGKSEITFKRLIDYHLHIGKSYFAEDVCGIRLIGANSSLFGSGLGKEKTMWQFLDNELGKKSDKPVLFFLHHPLFQKKPEEKGGEYWNLEPAHRFRLFGLFQQAGVSAVFSAHLHKPLTNYYNNVLYYTTHPVSFGLPKGKQKSGWTLLTISNTGIKLNQYFIESTLKQEDKMAINL